MLSDLLAGPLECASVGALGMLVHLAGLRLHVVLVKLLGAVRSFEFVALAGNAKQGNGHYQQGENFHRAAS